MQQAGSSPAATELQQLLATPPENFQGGNNPHAIAHASLQALRDSGDLRFLFLRTILELSSTAFPHQEELLFHCITGCRHVILTKWNTFSELFRKGVRDYFMALGNNSNNLNISRTIRLAFYNASASFWKRQWNETTTNVNNHLRPEEKSLLELISANQQQLHIPQLNTKADLFHYLDQVIAHPTTMASAASYLTILVGEFAGKSASNYNMPLEFHKRAHATFFGENWLDQALQMSMKALSQVVTVITTNSDNNIDEELAVTVVQVAIDIIAWEFDAWEQGGFPQSSGSKALVRPPAAWRDVLMQPEFVKAVFHVHNLYHSKSPKLAHCIRQLLLVLTSLSGPMFQSQDERKTFCTYLLEGILGLLTTSTSEAAQESSELLDTLSMISRLIVNYKLSILVQLPLMQNLHQGVRTIGRHLLQENLKECESIHGDLESMEHREWREEALALLLEGIVLMCGDPWLLYSGSDDSRKAAQSALATTLGPLYADFVTCRTRMALLEEQYLTAHETELDEVREEIFAVDLEEEMTLLANVGRLDLQASLNCLSALFQQLIPKLQALWDGNVGVVSPEAAGLLEESRIVTMYIGHLLTDDNAGETPVIPDSIIIACQEGDAVTNSIMSAVQTLHQFAHFQAVKIAAHPSDPRLSPILAKSFLWFLERWAPAYILPVDYGAAKMPSSILKAWSSTEAVQEAVSFSVTLCLHYHCYWPHERQVQDNAAILLLSLAKRCSKMRLAMVSSPSFRQLVTFHCLTSEIRHSAPPGEFESTVRSKAGNATDIPLDMLRGYQRLPYDIKSKILTVIIVGCSEHDDENSKALLNDCLKALHDAFSSLVHVLATKQASPDNVDAREMTCLCVELYGGVARAGDMVASERIPKFLSPSLRHLSGLMAYYAADLTICECLLCLFRDYAEQFIAVLDSESCLVLFQSSADLLKSYSSIHCASSRIIKHDAEEEQSYNDILCAIQLLIQLGTKDFIDVGEKGIDSVQVTDMIFFGLQQILPLMTRGLLQFPTLCTQYFSLVGFMMETYPEKVGVLPYELFDALLESLLFGMSHHDTNVAKSSLQGLAGIAREHLQSKVLDVQLAKNNALLDNVSRRLLLEVVFQNIIWDRLETAGMALLPIAAIDLSKFATVVQGITQQISVEHQQRLSSAFEGLLKQEALSKVSTHGYEGRQNRIRFKKDFENFCQEIHSFLLMK